MFGKGALIALLGFFIAFSVFQIKMSRMVSSSLNNFNEDYVKTQLYHAKLSAMNIGLSKAWNEDWLNGSFDVVIDQCSTNVSISEAGVDTLKLKVRTWSQAYNNGDKGYSGNTYQVNDSVTAFFRYNASVSEYFWFTESEGTNIYWTTKDTVWGPWHTNGVMKIYGSPVFYNKVTCLSMLPLPGVGTNNGKFFGGWELGITNSVEKDMTHLSEAAVLGNGAAAPNTKCIYDEETAFEFLADGRVIRSVNGDPPDTVALTDIAPTEVLYSSEDIRIKGVLNGKLTVYSERDIYLDDDLVLADNPITNPASDDMIGIVADDDIIITENAANNSDINIQGAMMAINGSFGAENYSSRPVSGTIYMTGSIYQQTRGPVGTFNWWGIHSGFVKYYRFDERLFSISPPHYPYIKNIHLVGWWE